MYQQNVLARRSAKGFGAFGARADVAEMVVAVDAGGVAVGEADLNGVVAHLRGSTGDALSGEANSPSEAFFSRASLQVAQGHSSRK
jgi:hypothetical protein